MCTTKKEVKVFQNSNSTDAVTLCDLKRVSIKARVQDTTFTYECI